MRKIKEVLRLHASNQSIRQIALCCNISRPTVSDYLRRSQDAGLSWPLPADLTDTALEAKLFPPLPTQMIRGRQRPDWAYVQLELKRKGVTKFLLWQEYRVQHPQGCQYSWFCDQYRLWLGQQNLSMRQHHRAGEKLFVDYAGHTVPIIDQRTGEARFAQIFVAVMGASNYTYAEATWSQSLPDWIGSHQRAFSFLGGTPETVVPDNLRSGVSKAHQYEPEINPTYQDMAEHYHVTVIPARARRPKDKAKAEVGVQIVERWILAALRHRTFFSLVELNQAIKHLLVNLNQRPFKKRPGCRQDAFQTLDAPLLRALPITPYAFAEWKKVRVNIDYHVEIQGHYYSVPHALRQKQLDARITDYTVECFLKGQRIASHARSIRKGSHTTVREHMPKSHQHYGDWSPQRLHQWASKTGPAAHELITRVLATRHHPEQGYRSCLGILRLGKAYGQKRLEAACARALLLGTCRYKSIESILKSGLDQQPLPAQEEPSQQTLPEDHDNVRGPSYYH